MRNEYTFNQIKEQLQAFAVDILVDTANMFSKEYKGKLHVTSYEDGWISKIETELYEFRFYSKHVAVYFKISGGKVLKDSIWFDIEHKVYSDSPHSTKISFYCNMPKMEEERKAQILQFIAELMGDIKPERRFSLKNFPSKPRSTEKKTEKEICEKVLEI
jgi:hypothetical protein